MYVIGTAGHVDHGKSTLVQALTGIDPDRLAEEKERELTIDLGFAWLELQVGDEREEVGVVDVPGHRDFIENMLAGVGGIDLALLVVAADEAVMPQTSEHLAILDLLEVPRGVVALTKVDLIEDQDWLELVTLDLSETLAGTVLQSAPILPVSARSGRGIDALRQSLGFALSQAQPKPDNGRPRLPVDRVFTLSGFGTIVTGTLVDGALHIGDTVEIQPGGLRGRIRGLQTHKTKREVAYPGSRVAVNIAGVDADDITRGHVLAAPDTLRDTLLVDASYRHLDSAPAPLKHNVEVKLFAGAAEVMARTRIIGARQIAPGESGWLQLALRQPLAVARGDHFILRRPSPGTTLGGGKILDAHPGRRHRRFRAEVSQRLQTLAEGTPADLLLEKLSRLEPLPSKELLEQSGLDPSTRQTAWLELQKNGLAVELGHFALTSTFWRTTTERMARLLAEYHQTYPLRPGIPREELRSRLGLSASAFNALLEQAVAEGMLQDSGTIVYLPTHSVRFSQQQQARIDSLMKQFEAAGVNSPAVRECRDTVGNDVYEALVDLGHLVQLSEDVVYEANLYRQLTSRVMDHFQRHETANAAEIRDLLDTSRKYAIALLEHFDQERITRRIGDERVLLPDAVSRLS